MSANIFENRPSAGNGGNTTAQDIAAALYANGIGANTGKLLRVDIPNTWEFPRRCSDGAITAVADAGDEEHVVITSAAHGVRNGDPITIAGTTDYDGEFVVSSVAPGTFEIVATWTATATGTWSFAPEYISPEIVDYEGVRASRFYFGELEDGDEIGPAVDSLLGVYMMVQDATVPETPVREACRTRFVKGAEFAAISESEGTVSVEISVTTSTLEIINAWIDVIVTGA